MTRKILVAWPELDVTVTATLATDQSPQLCQEFVAHLPFGVVQSHPTVSGSSVTMWLPYLSKAPTPATESIAEAPVGRIRLSQGTGSKLSIQYGPGLEPARQAVLGVVDEEFVHVLPDVGREVWDNLYWRKQPMNVHFRILSADGATAQPSAAAAAPSHELAREIAAAADAIQLTEPEDIGRLRRGEIPDAGSFGQYFSVWDAAHGLVRDFTTNTLYPVYVALGREGLAAARLIYGSVGVKYHFPLRYHGLVTLADFAVRFQEVLDTEDDPAVVTEVFEELLRYGNATYAWSHQQFPWHLGMQFPSPGSPGLGGVWRRP